MTIIERRMMEAYSRLLCDVERSGAPLPGEKPKAFYSGFSYKTKNKTIFEFQILQTRSGEHSSDSAITELRVAAIGFNDNHEYELLCSIPFIDTEIIVPTFSACAETVIEEY